MFIVVNKSFKKSCFIKQYENREQQCVHTRLLPAVHEEQIDK